MLLASMPNTEHKTPLYAAASVSVCFRPAGFGLRNGCNAIENNTQHHGLLLAQKAPCLVLAKRICWARKLPTEPTESRSPLKGGFPELGFDKKRQHRRAPPLPRPPRPPPPKKKETRGLGASRHGGNVPVEIADENLSKKQEGDCNIVFATQAFLPNT